MILSLCAGIPDSKSRWPRGRKAYFRGGDPLDGNCREKETSKMFEFVTRSLRRAWVTANNVLEFWRHKEPANSRKSVYSTKVAIKDKSYGDDFRASARWRYWDPNWSHAAGGPHVSPTECQLQSGLAVGEEGAQEISAAVASYAIREPTLGIATFHFTAWTTAADSSAEQRITAAQGWKKQ